MPLTKKGKKIMKAMKKQYGKEKGQRVFYASANKGKIEGVHESLTQEDIDKYATEEEKEFLKEDEEYEKRPKKKYRVSCWRRLSYSITPDHLFDIKVWAINEDDAIDQGWDRVFELGEATDDPDDHIIEAEEIK